LARESETLFGSGLSRLGIQPFFDFPFNQGNKVKLRKYARLDLKDGKSASFIRPQK